MMTDTRLWSDKAKTLTPYVAGEQPKHDRLCKLNTNENPFAPSPSVLDAIKNELAQDADKLRLYPDPNSDELKEALAQFHGLDAKQVFVGNGSDEVLALVFAAFFMKSKPVLTADIGYSFYPVYANAFGVDLQTIALNDDFEVDVADYKHSADGVILANPNAPTGVLLSLEKIRQLISYHKDAVVVIDEAYIDYADEGSSCISLINEFDNLVVTQTFSKSRALAGLRVGAAFASVHLIAALTAMKDSFNSYPLDKLAQAAAIASVKDVAYFQEKRKAVIALREELTTALNSRGFDVLPSSANFIFANPCHAVLSTFEIFEKLREQGVIVRHWQKDRIKDYLRITVGTSEQNARLLEVLDTIL
ncbi:histidinol-phosphate transaminase [Moraxella nasovis]|uniref:histidinol-phosphate transaminase n=1 Tax=Moraxella nasovis TaxID=2904121 RepID=UPI001F619175|nr:histidinol-phosphate transaminase [Moraxella nasovis]UNU72681.1 histidinol-phosphate transaminase [Moraxella nasovis]